MNSTMVDIPGLQWTQYSGVEKIFNIESVDVKLINVRDLLAFDCVYLLSAAPDNPSYTNEVAPVGWEG